MDCAKHAHSSPKELINQRTKTKSERMGAFSDPRLMAERSLLIAEKTNHRKLSTRNYNMRVGFGFDVHRLVEGRPLILGGITVPFEKGLDGHSDADVLLHAITDALLGAAAMGDIGLHFPDTDPQWKGADSRKLLAHVGSLLGDEGYTIRNIDATVAMQRPKLRPYIDAMRQSIADTLQLEISQVSVKATTTEKLGFVGIGQGVSAYAVCAIFPETNA